MSALALACPGCHGPLASGEKRLACRPCDTAYACAEGPVDFVADGHRDGDGLGPVLMSDPLHVPLYEASSRPAFLRVMGANWDERLSEADERRWLERWLDPVDGVVLDLACGAGGWTRTIADAVGPARVVGLDRSVAMLAAARERLPDVTLVRASAEALPFGDATLGAVVCWNALQMLPAPDRVLVEAARCLRSGGRFAALTFRLATDPVYRHFQRQIEAAFDVRAFTEPELIRRLTAAGLTPEQVDGPGTFLIVSARKAV